MNEIGILLIFSVLLYTLFRIVFEISNLRKKLEDTIHLVRFLAETWKVTDDFIYENCTDDQLMKYPVIQGTRNQINIQNIGKQKYDKKRLQNAISIILDA